MTMEQQVNTYLFSNFMMTVCYFGGIFFFFFVSILTVAQIANTANLTSVSSYHHSLQCLCCQFAISLLHHGNSMDTMITRGPSQPL